MRKSWEDRVFDILIILALLFFAVFVGFVLSGGIKDHKKPEIRKNGEDMINTHLYDLMFMNNWLHLRRR
jgi:hypothetical protein